MEEMEYHILNYSLSKKIKEIITVTMKKSINGN
jgi:hypothetical protein